jgi:hypothetical protein
VGFSEWPTFGFLDEHVGDAILDSEDELALPADETVRLLGLGELTVTLRASEQ